MVNARLTLPAPTRALVRSSDPAHCKLSPRSRRGGRADALSATAVPESAALMLPNIAGCRILDLRSSPCPAVTQRSRTARQSPRDARPRGSQQPVRKTHQRDALGLWESIKGFRAEVSEIEPPLSGQSQISLAKDRIVRPLRGPNAFTCMILVKFGSR